MLIAPSDIPAIWPQVEEGVASALRPFHEHTADSARANCEAGRWALWMAEGGGGALTTLCHTPLRRFVFVIAVWGRGRGARIVPTLRAQIDDHARRHGCDAVQAVGRKGWRRSHLRPADARHVADLYEWVV